MATELPYWLLLESLTVRGREDDDNDDSSDDGSEDDDDGDNEDDSSDDSSDDSKKNKEGDDENVQGLLSALKAERKQRRDAEKRAKAAERKLNAGKKPKEDDGGDDGSKDDSEIQEQLRSEQTKTTRLAERLRLREIDAAIIQVAQDAGFIDPTDAVTDFIRNQVDYDQDEDDPAEVEIDMDTVEDAVKKLARKKKHLVGEVPDKNRQKSGSKFRKKAGDDGDKSSLEKTLQANYPSLR